MARLAAAVLAALAAPAFAQDPDRDGDGLSDFQEVHKYGTDPTRRDSDGDGVPDGDWRERREYAYTVRCVVQVLRPVTPEHLNDDYQDARVLGETDRHVELEVIHYPFNTVATAVTANRDWRKTAATMKQWTAPGPTADWTPKTRDALVAALSKAGIDAATLDDRTLVTKAAGWLLRHAKYQDGFTTFLTSFDAQGKPFVEPELRAAARTGQADKSLTLEAQWRREISARGMFESGVRGSCTSTAIYLNGCLRALGVPTRIVLCIPLIDASDKNEPELVRRGIRHASVRDAVLAFAERAKKSWTSHTFNEVFVGGRWWRLNDDRLAQNSFDFGLLGLMTHVGTWGDWADARMPKTVGRRQAGIGGADAFGGANPYSTIAIEDQVDAHAKVAPVVAQLGRARWSDDTSLPPEVRGNLEKTKRPGILVEVRGAQPNELQPFVEASDRDLLLDPEEKPPFPCALEKRCSWGFDDHLLVLVRLDPEQARGLGNGSVAVQPRNGTPATAWLLAHDLRVVPR